MLDSVLGGERENTYLICMDEIPFNGVQPYVNKSGGLDDILDGYAPADVVLL